MCVLCVPSLAIYAHVVETALLRTSMPDGPGFVFLVHLESHGCLLDRATANPNIGKSRRKQMKMIMMMMMMMMMIIIMV